MDPPRHTPTQTLTPVYTIQLPGGTSPTVPRPERLLPPACLRDLLKEPLNAPRSPDKALPALTLRDTQLLSLFINSGSQTSQVLLLHGLPSLLGTHAHACTPSQTHQPLPATSHTPRASLSLKHFAPSLYVCTLAHRLYDFILYALTSTLSITLTQFLSLSSLCIFKKLLNPRSTSTNPDHSHSRPVLPSATPGLQNLEFCPGICSPHTALCLPDTVSTSSIPAPAQPPRGLPEVCPHTPPTPCGSICWCSSVPASRQACGLAGIHSVMHTLLSVFKTISCSCHHSTWVDEGKAAWTVLCLPSTLSFLICKTGISILMSGAWLRDWMRGL